MSHTCLYFPVAEHHHTGWYSFPIPLRVGGWVGLGGWLYTTVVCHPKMVTHPNTNLAKCKAASLMCQRKYYSFTATVSVHHGCVAILYTSAVLVLVLDFHQSVRFRFGFGLKRRFRFRFQNRNSTTFNKNYNQPLACLHSANKPTTLQQSSTRHSRRSIKAN